MIKFIKNHKKEILISLGTGVILFYAEPVLKFLSNKIISIAISISKEYSNKFYTALSKKDLGEFDEFNSTILSYLFILAILFSYGFFRKIIYDFDSKLEIHKRKSLDIKDRVEKSKLKLQGSNQTVESKTKEEKRNEIEKELAQIQSILLQDESFIIKTNAKLNRIKKLSAGLAIIFSIVVIMAFFLYSQISLRKSMIIKFQNKIEAIKPYATENEINKYNSSWALIRNSDDYENLIIEIEKKMNDANIVF